MEIWIVDRLEEDIIIIENNNNILKIKKDELEFGVKEGDILTKNELGKFIKNVNAKKEREEYIYNLTKDLWEN